MFLHVSNEKKPEANSQQPRKAGEGGWGGERRLCVWGAAAVSLGGTQTGGQQDSAGRRQGRAAQCGNGACKGPEVRPRLRTM